MTNSAINLLKHIGGTAAIMVTPDPDKAEIAKFKRQDAIDNPVPKRMAQPLRSYLKRYRNDLAEYLIAKRKGLAINPALVAAKEADVAVA